MKEEEWNIIQKIVATMIVQRERALSPTERGQKDAETLGGRIEELKEQLFKH